MIKLVEQRFTKHFVTVESKTKKFVQDTRTKVRVPLQEKTQLLDMQNYSAFSSESDFQLHRNKETNLYENEYVCYVGVFKFPDGNVTFNLITKKVCYSCKTDTIFYKTGKVHTLKIFGESGRIQFTLNGRLCYTNRLIEEFYAPYYDLVHSRSNNTIDIQNLLNQYCKFPKSAYPSTISSWYHASRNVNFKDLPWDVENIESLYEPDNTLYRKRILYHLRKKDTKKAIDTVLHKIEFPKSVKKRLYKVRIGHLTPHVCVGIKECLNNYDVNNTNTILDIILNSNIPNNYIRNTLELCSLNLFSPKHVINTLNSDKFNGISLIADVMRLRRSSIDIPDIENSITIKEYHDMLDLYVRTKANKDKTELLNLYNNTDLSKPELDYSSNEFSVSVPSNANVLTEAGNILNICVGSYKREFYLGCLDIAILRDKNNSIIGCIELVNDTIVQAKLKYNKRVSSSQDIFEFVKAWSRTKNLVINTSDLGVETKAFSYNIANPERKENLNAVNSRALRCGDNAFIDIF